MVALTVTSNRSVYTAGAPVHLTIALHNRSTSACSFTTGPRSPQFILSNATGVAVWGSCWFSGSRAPCADYLLRRTLGPGDTYRDRLTWDQRTGHPDLAVPAGRYTFTGNFVGQSIRAAMSFVLTRSRNVNVSLADSGHHFTLNVGDLLLVRLSGPWVWASAQSSNPGIMAEVPEMNPATGLFVFRALVAGAARISAVGNPACYPQCLMPSRLFYVDVSVRAS